MTLDTVKPYMAAEAMARQDAKQTFEEKLREHTDRFDDMDCRPGPSTDLNPDAVTPEHVKRRIAGRQRRRE